MTDEPASEEVPSQVGGDTPEATLEPLSEPTADTAVSWKRRARLAAIVVGVTLTVWLLFTWVTWPDVAALRTEDPETTAFIEMYREARHAAG